MERSVKIYPPVPEPWEKGMEKEGEEREGE